MRICVTGSSGFIGDALVKALLKSNHQVLGIDINPPRIFHDTFEHCTCNILEFKNLEKVLIDFQPEIIFHLAARIDLNETRNINGYAANIDGVRNLVDIIRNLKSVSRVIYTSSQLVCRVGYIPISEKDYKPSTLYGESKILTEEIVRENNGGNVEWCIVRPTTVWGPGMSAHYQKFFKMISAGKYFHVGNKSLNKSYSYIGNIVFQYLMLMKAPVSQIDKKTFYLADYNPLSLRYWSNLIQESLEAKPIPTYPTLLVKFAAYFGDFLNFIGLKKFPFNSFRLNNVLTEYLFDLSHTQEVCGDLPFSIEEGVKETIKSLKEENILS